MAIQISNNMKRKIQKRHNKARLFRAFGLLATLICTAFVVLIISNVVFKAWPTFYRYEITVSLAKEDIVSSGFTHIKQAVVENITHKLEKVSGQKNIDSQDILTLISLESLARLRSIITHHPDFQFQEVELRLPLSSEADVSLKGSRGFQENYSGKLSPKELEYLDLLQQAGCITKHTNWDFLFGTDSREAELAGIKSALIGSLMTVLIAIIISFPVGISSAIYLEEFSRKNPFISFIEININNLAAVPSIIFGILGLAIFINFFDLPRASALVGGLTLSLMMLPTLIIATKTALRSVPKSIREASLGLGASKVQTVFHHVLPLAAPGILTGSIISVARTLGESAPLIMLGMIAFILDPAESIFDPTTTLPVQIYSWSKNPEFGFSSNTSAAILILILLLSTLNLIAIFIRNRFAKNGRL